MAESVYNVIHVKQEPPENDDANPEQQPQNNHPPLTFLDVRLLDRFCRLCLRQRSNLIPLHSRIRDMSVPEVFRAITGLELILEDNNPLKACRTCMEALDYAYDIHQNFTESYRILKTFLLSKPHLLINHLSEYQGGLRATSETLAERMLREYRDLRSQRETVDQQNGSPTLNPCVSTPQPQEELIRLPVQIKQEPKLILRPEERSNPKITIAEAMTKNVEPLTEGILPECRDLRSQEETVDQCKADPKLNLCVNIPRPQEEPIEVPVQIKHEPELILEPEELPYSANTAAEAIMDDDEPPANEFGKNHGHSDKVGYNCKQCGKKYLKKWSFRAHVSAHKALDEGRYTCSYCDKKFATKAGLTQHKRIHTGEKPYQCNACAESFRAKWYLREHMSNIHTKSEHVPVITCQFEGCDFSTTKKRNHYHHKATHELKFQCTQCPQRFPTKQILKNHQPVHTGVKEFSCQQCNKSYKNKKSLDAHMDDHNNRRRFACEFCGMTFVREQILKQHLLKHSSQLSFECRHCGEKFRYRTSRVRHEKTHTEAAVKLIDPVH